MQISITLQIKYEHLIMHEYVQQILHVFLFMKLKEVTSVLLTLSALATVSINSKSRMVMFSLATTVISPRKFLLTN